MNRIFSIALLVMLWIATAVGQNEQASALISEGDRYSEKAFDNQKALASFEKALKAEPNNAEILWRISRSYVDIGEHLPAGTKEEKTKQLEYYQKSTDFANQAIGANPNSSMAYTRRAIANGRIALFKGIWDALDLVKQVKADCEKAIQLDNGNAAAHYVLARTHYKVCEKPKMIRWPLGLSWGNLDESRAQYEKAIALRPNFIMYRLDAARTYVELDEYGLAREQLTKIQTLGTEDEDDNQFRKEAKELLEKIQDK
jgi:tetratricopeptide (TPR) repeat protein